MRLPCVVAMLVLCTSFCAFAAEHTAALPSTSVCEGLRAKMMPAGQQAYKTAPGAGLFQAFCGKYQNGGETIVVVPIKEADGTIDVYFATGLTPPGVTPWPGSLSGDALTWQLNIPVGARHIEVDYSLERGPDGTYRVHSHSPKVDADTGPLEPMQG